MSDMDRLKYQYEETIEALEDELEFLKQQAAKCRIAKAAVQRDLDEKEQLLMHISDSLGGQMESLANLITIFKDIDNALGLEKNES